MSSLSITKRRQISLALLCGWTLLVTVMQLFFATVPGAYVPTFLYFVVPTVHLLWWYRINWRKIAAGAILIGILIPLSFDLLVQLNGSWTVPLETLLIPYQLLGFYPVDEIIWFFLLALYTIVFYEVFVDHDITHRLSRNFHKAIKTWAVVSIVTFAVIFFARNLLLVPYSYFVIFAPFSLPPIAYVLWKKPHLLRKFILPTAFFFFVALNFEIVGLTFGHWIFKSQYIGWFSAFGRFFPFEELFYWMLLYPATALSYYELLVDDKK